MHNILIIFSMQYVHMRMHSNLMPLMMPPGQVGTMLLYCEWVQMRMAKATLFACGAELMMMVVKGKGG